MEQRVKIDSIAFGGSGVGRLDGKVCFIEGALPGEEVAFDKEKETSSYIKGRVSAVLESSPDRIEPACPYYGICGGCQFQHVSYEKELLYKKDQAAGLVNRFAGIKDFTCGMVVAPPEPYGYRSSITLNRGEDGYGYYEKNSRKVVKVDNCIIAEDCLNASLGSIRKDAGDRITLKSDHKGQVWSSVRPGERFFPDRYRDIEMMFSPQAFSQCNRYIAEKISATIEEWVGDPGRDTSFFDAYCGIGFFSFLTRYDFRVKVGIDSERISIDCAKTTARSLGLDGVKFYKGIVEDKFPEIFRHNMSGKNIVLLDPPRKGIKEGFLKWLASADGMDKIMYTSCNPSTLARDMKAILDSGRWRLGRSALFDMFPRTGHIEMLVEFER